MNSVLVTGEKESFLIKVLMKKIKEAGIGCEFVNWNVNDLHKKLPGTGAVVMYMDEGERPGDDVLQFLKDRTLDDEKHLVPIGAPADIKYVCDKVAQDHIYRSFTRPADNGELVGALTELFSKAASGAFRRSVLVVDDDPGFLGLVREWLKDRYTVTGVTSGMQAIKWLGKNSADLILLDYEMPVTTGPQVFEMLRSDEDTKDIPVMFLTGKSDRESVMAVLALKPDGYFLKSIKKKELLDRLDEFFILRDVKNAVKM